MSRKTFDRSTRIALGLSLLLHLCAAYFSVGYNWFDEYFQIVEFAGYKLGRTPAVSLPWEFQKQVRPWLEPSICYAIARVESLLGIHSPTAWLFTFQLLGALLGWASLVAIADLAAKWIRDPQRLRYAIYSLCAFWFLPWFHARTSSENWSSSVFFIGAWLWLTRDERRLRGAALDLVAGLLWGFAFFFRFQVAAMIIGGGLWLLKERKLRFWTASSGFFLAMGLCTLIDRWGYGNWAPTWWNYFYVCVVQHVSASFGEAPWWDYFRLMWVQAPPLLGALVILVCLAAWIRKPDSFITWVGVPMVLMHMGLAHKELRYLFPIAPLVPLLPWIILEGANPRVLKPAGVALLALDAPFLIFGTFTAEKNSFRLLEFISDRFPEKLELYAAVPDPFEDIKTLYFLRPLDYRFHLLSSPIELPRAVEQSASGVYFFHNKTDFSPEFTNAVSRCEPTYRTFGPAFRRVDFNGWLERAANWQLYWCPKS